MAEPEKKKFTFNKLGKVEKGLYAREEVQPSSPAIPVVSASASGLDVPQEWKDEVPEHLPDAPVKKHLIPPVIMKKIVLGAVIFFIISAAFGAYVFFGGVNRVSTDNVMITVNGPSTIGAGEPLSYNVSVRNNNNVPLEGVKLLIDYPEGTRAQNEQEDLPRDLEDIGTIGQGESIERTKQAVIFGEADSSQHIIISVEYRVKDSSATYFKEQYYDLLISTAPVRMSINAIEESVSGNEIEFETEIVSNSTSVISGLMLKVDFPFGFEYRTASPSPSFGNNVFIIGDLQPADRRVIRIRGIVTGQEGDSRLFRFGLGLPDKQDTRLIGTVFLSSSQTVAIKRPFISATLSLDGSSDESYSVTPGQVIRGEIVWTNNLDSRVVDLEIKAKLKGESLNRLSINAGSGGFYRSLDDIILWDKTTSQQFAVIEPGETGIATFSFASKSLSSLLYSGIRGNEISVEITVNARRLSGSSIPEQIVTGISRKARVSSSLALTGRSLYFTGPFSNQGPVPPQADRSTTYTIGWSLTNTLNNVSGVRVVATLPGYVTWLGNVNGGSETVTYDAVSRQVLWDVGEVPASTGFSSPPREVYFQVSLVPSLSHLGTSPAIISEAVVNGVDRYSNATLRSAIKMLSTDIDDAPAGMSNSDRVVQ